MNNPHEPQAAAMARAGELTDGEQLRECINSGQVSAAQVVAYQEAGEYGWRTECLKAEAALAAERAEVARLTGLLKNIRTVHGEWFGNEISSETAITYTGMYLAEDAATPGEKHD